MTFKDTFACFLCATAFIAVLAGHAMAEGRSIEILPGTPAASVNALIETAQKGDRILFSSGVFSFAEKLVITTDGVSLVGKGPDRTVLEFQRSDDDLILVDGGKRGKPLHFTEDSKVDDMSIELADTSGLDVGDSIYVKSPNTRRYISRWDNVNWSEAKKRPFRESIHTISDIEGDVVELETALPFRMKNGAALAKKVELREGVRLSGFTVTSRLEDADPFDFTNTQSDANRVAAIRAKHTRGLKIDRVHIIDSPSNALVLQSSIEADINRMTISGAFNKGGGGNGYGVELRESFDNDLRNLIIEDMRHAVIFSAWHAEVRNRVHVKSTNRDINFHGSVDLDNEVKVDRLVLEYASDRSRKKRRNVWKALSPGGSNHAETDFLAVNTVELTRAKGSWRDDVLVASQDAALTGGFGEDLFVVKKDAVITDFEEADSLDFSHSKPVDFMERGNDIVLILENGGEVVLRDQH